MFALIMAGGGGTRFWPKSRRSHPKQFLKLINNRSMIQLTYDRLKGIVKEKDIFVVSTRDHEHLIIRHLPGLARKNLIIEPVGRNTAPCIALAALYLKRIDPQGVMAVLPSDHLIAHERKFHKVLKAAEELVNRLDCYLTLGITPSYAATGYGYIQYNNKVAQVDGIPAYHVKTFAEKPIQEVAERFIQSGDFLWNSGIFFWRVDTLLKGIERYMPDLFDWIVEIDRAIGTPQEQKELFLTFPNIRPVSIDYGLMERTENVVVMKADFGWSDIGSWKEVYKIGAKTADKNVVKGDNILIDVKNSFIESADGRLIAAINVENLVIVSTDDAVLVCQIDSAQEVKEIVDRLKRNKMTGYL